MAPKAKLAPKVTQPQRKQSTTVKKTRASTELHDRALSQTARRSKSDTVRALAAAPPLVTSESHLLHAHPDDWNPAFSLTRYSSMLRAIYLITLAEKAQLKVRLGTQTAPLPIGDLYTLRSGVAHYAAGLPSPGRAHSMYNRWDGMVPLGTPHKAPRAFLEPEDENAAPPGSPRRLQSSQVESSLTRTPPPSPSRLWVPPTNSHVPTVQAADANTLSIVAFADQRWRTAVGECLHSTFTLDHLAQVAELFPEYIRVAWSTVTPSHSASTQRVEDRMESALRELAELDRDLCTSSTSYDLGLQASGAVSRRNDAIRARVTLLKAEVPAEDVLEKLVTELQSQDARLRISAQQALVRDTAEHPRSRQLTPHSTALRQPFNFESVVQEAVRGDVEDSNRAKRPREDSDGTSSCSSSAVTDLSIPQDLLDCLSDAKLRVIYATQTEASKSALVAEQRRIAAMQRAEKLLCSYDLIRIIVGPNRASVGGAKLIADLTSQNRHGESEAEMVKHVSHLLSFPESGLTAKLLSPDEPERREDESCIKDCVILLDLGAKRLALETAIEQRCLSETTSIE